MVMYTCPERQFTRAATLASLGRSDWRSDFRLVVDVASGTPSLARMAATFMRALDAAAHSHADFVVIVEDDLRFNAHLEHNLRAWLPEAQPMRLGSLYRSSLGRKVGAQALVGSPSEWLVLWKAASAKRPIELQPFDVWIHGQVPVNRFRFHQPALVQHAAHASTCGHPQHHAPSFDESWRA